MQKIRVVVADNHPAFREGLCRLLGDEEEIEVVGQAADGAAIVDLSRELKPDVAIVDMAMPKMTGIEATKKIIESSPTTAVLILSAFNYQTYVLASLRAGAVGYLTKDAPIKKLVTAIRVAHRKDDPSGPGAANDFIWHLPGDSGAKKKTQSLTSAEIDVLKLAARGLRNKNIARQLAISERTVARLLVRILSKLDSDSRTEAVLEALRQGWLNVRDLW